MADNDDDDHPESSASVILEETIDSVAWMLARKIHQNGHIPRAQHHTYPSESIADRQSLYPGLYSSEEELAKDLERYAVEVPKRRKLSSTTAPDEQELLSEQPNTSTGESINGSSTPSAVVTRQQVNSMDIWGRCPPKEPKETIECSICHRQVNTLRFAPHLDKCMGIGTTSRASSSGANR
jgi:hypothetical protein